MVERARTGRQTQTLGRESMKTYDDIHNWQGGQPQSVRRDVRALDVVKQAGSRSEWEENLSLAWHMAVKDAQHSTACVRDFGGWAAMRVGHEVDVLLGGGSGGRFHPCPRYLHDTTWRAKLSEHTEHLGHTATAALELNEYCLGPARIYAIVHPGKVFKNLIAADPKAIHVDPAIKKFLSPHSATYPAHHLPLLSYV
ncbi:hypothetical protein FGB62_128g118 [Gracilaria domingensis]|nr:hypothetical protein FGB62_128g118 [Gracilaria domingensis]